MCHNTKPMLQHTKLYISPHQALCSATPSSMCHHTKPMLQHISSIFHHTKLYVLLHQALCSTTPSLCSTSASSLPSHQAISLPPQHALCSPASSSMFHLIKIYVPPHQALCSTIPSSIFHNTKLYVPPFQPSSIAEGGDGDMLPLSIKCPLCTARVSTSLWQLSPAPSLLVWLRYKPGATASDSTDHVVRLGDHMRRALARKRVMLSCFFDIERAFGTVWHGKLLYQLKQAGISPSLYRFINSFLTGRTMAVQWKNTISPKRTIDTGVPQGSVIAPMLFTLMLQNVGKGLQKDTTVTA